MWIPKAQSASASPSLQFSYGFRENGSAGAELRAWSSIIGIVTAIAGNILISFALNTQRYAHIRLEREYYEKRKSARKGGKGCFAGPRAYGTNFQGTIAEERSDLDPAAPGPGTPQRSLPTLADGEMSPAEGGDSGKTQPLKDSSDSGRLLGTTEKGLDSEDEGRKSYLKSGYWWLGIIMMTVGEAGNFFAYGFAPASIVSPLGVVALVSNCVIAPFMLKERFRQRDFWGVLVAIGGAVTVVLSAKNSESKMGPDDLWHAISRWEFLLYLGITAVAIIALIFARPRYGERTILVDLGLVALFGGYTALSTKGVASLLSDTLWHALTFPITYLLVAVLVLSALMQIRYINRALQRFDSTEVIPTQFVLFTISVIIGSAVLYRDFESTTASRAAKFICGCLLTFFGVYLITSRRPSGEGEQDFDTLAEEEEEEEEGEEEEEEEAIHLIDNEAEEQVGGTSLKETAPNPHSQLTPSRRSSSSELAPDASISTLDKVGDPDPWAASLERFADKPSATELGSSTKESRSAVHRSQSERPEPFNRPQFDLSQMQTPISPNSSRVDLPSLLLRTPSGPADPQTPTRAGRTASPPKADQDVRLGRSPSSAARSARGSISRLLPGPLLSPLSSSLSVVVADSLLRGEGTSRTNRIALARSRSSRRQSRHHSIAGDDRQLATRESEPSGDVDANISDIDKAEVYVDQQKNQLRSMSETLGGLIGARPKSRQRDEEHGGQPEP